MQLDCSTTLDYLNLLVFYWFTIPSTHIQTRVVFSNVTIYNDNLYDFHIE